MPQVKFILKVLENRLWGKTADSLMWTAVKMKWQLVWYCQLLVLVNTTELN